MSDDDDRPKILLLRGQQWMSRARMAALLGVSERTVTRRVDKGLVLRKVTSSGPVFGLPDSEQSRIERDMGRDTDETLDQSGIGGPSGHSSGHETGHINSSKLSSPERLIQHLKAELSASRERERIYQKELVEMSQEIGAVRRELELIRQQYSGTYPDGLSGRIRHALDILLGRI